MKNMENNKNYGNVERGAQEKMSEIQKSIDKFYEENPNILQAVKLFGISNSEYEKAVSTMYEPRIYNVNNTNGGDI